MMADSKGAKNDLASFAVLLQWQLIVYSDNFLTEHWPEYGKVS